MPTYELIFQQQSNQEFVYFIDRICYLVANSDSLDEARKKAKKHVEFLKKIRNDSWPFI